MLKPTVPQRFDLKTETRFKDYVGFHIPDYSPGLQTLQSVVVGFLCRITAPRIFEQIKDQNVLNLARGGSEGVSLFRLFVY